MNVVAPITLVLLLLAIVVAAIFLFSYFRPITKGPALATIWVIISWVITLSFIVLLPIDYSLYLYHECMDEFPDNCSHYSTFMDSPATLITVWNVLYWTNFVNIWVFIPFFQDYYRSGGFTLWQKVKYSLRNNIILYSVMLGVALLALIVLLASRRFTFQNLLGVLTGVAAFFSMLVFILVLGIGMVSVPKSLWRKGNLQGTKNKEAVLLIKHERSMNDQARKLYEELMKSESEVAGLIADGIRSPYIEQMQKTCTETRELLQTIRTSEFSAPPAQMHSLQIPRDRKLTPDQVKSLQKRHQALVKQYQRVEIEIQSVLMHAQTHEKIKLYMQRRKNLPKWMNFKLKVQYSRPSRILSRVASIALSIFSLLLLWSECTMFLPFDISPISIFLHLRALYSFQIIPFFLLLILMLVFVLSQLTSLRIGYFYQIIPHVTTPFSLLFFANYTSFFVSPLCQNALVLTHANLNKQTYFGDVISIMNVIPFVGRGFMAYYPISIVVIVILTATELVDRVLAKLKLKDTLTTSERTNQELIRQGERSAVLYGEINIKLIESQRQEATHLLLDKNTTELQDFGKGISPSPSPVITLYDSDNFYGYQGAYQFG
ncbi:putative LMBR1-like membrane protein [Blattamonas nauphoetae]|uniref:LMBR1-like membrane protein n=1 Tax=Blattamonas nauphoetae TaxID=2049346 RepID=A0ABQ9Y3E3_9EUKA|nr:putative LMBR1-like membrane protein [Blattamonas nauphoetae]